MAIFSPLNGLTTSRVSRPAIHSLFTKFLKVFIAFLLYGSSNALGRCVRNWSKLAAKWVGLAFLLLLMWLSVNADVQNEDNAGFRFARLQYPGGIPDYIKNWYTDYPAMNKHLTTLLGRLTGIDVAPPFLIEPSSHAIFDY